MQRSQTEPLFMCFNRMHLCIPFLKKNWFDLTILWLFFIFIFYNQKILDQDNFT